MTINRRDLFQAIGAAAGAAMLGATDAVGAELAAPATEPMPVEPAAVAKSPRAKPTPAQQKWMDLKFGLFLHFGINTYYDTEWSDGTLDPKKFNPTELDTDQWVSAAKAAGMKYLVLVTKHHDGFCNWPTKYTDYSVKATPFRGDVVRAVVDSARKHDLAVGFYYSLWDRHEKTHDDDWAYVAFMKRQLEELLTGYGPVAELWFDGFWKKQKHGWTKKPKREERLTAEVNRRDEAFVEAWRMEGAYRWQMDHVYQFVKHLQPDCLVMNNATTAYPGVPLHPVDIRSGEKAQDYVEYRKVWPWKGGEVYLPMQVETTMSQRGKDRFLKGSWFWHEWDHSVATKQQVLGWLANAEKMEANLLLNAGPMASGKLRPEDEELLRGLRG